MTGEGAGKITPESTALIILSAGRSTRFEGRHKLAALLNGRAVGDHIAQALEGLPFLARIAVVSTEGLHYGRRGYTLVTNPVPALGLSHSIKLGVEAAVKAGSAAILLALGDMPRVTSNHVSRLFAAQYGPDTIVASIDDEGMKPPALLSCRHFEALVRLEGDHGARNLIRTGRAVRAAPGELVDIDYAADLASLVIDDQEIR